MRLGTKAETRKVTPDDGLLDGVIEGHEELRVLSDATYKVPDKHIQAVGGGRLDARWDPAVVCLDVGLRERTLVVGDELGTKV